MQITSITCRLKIVICKNVKKKNANKNIFYRDQKNGREGRNRILLDGVTGPWQLVFPPSEGLKVSKNTKGRI